LKTKLDDLEWITIQEIMRRTNFSRATVDRKIAAGEIEGEKLGPNKVGVKVKSFIKWYEEHVKGKK